MNLWGSRNLSSLPARQTRTRRAEESPNCGERLAWECQDDRDGISGTVCGDDREYLTEEVYAVCEEHGSVSRESEGSVTKA